MDHPSVDPRPSFAHYLFSFAVLFLLWILLAGTLREDELIAGVVAALLVTVIAGPRLAILSGVRLTPLAPVHLVLYLWTFFTALIRSNFDVARRVLTPSLPIRPGVVEVETRLQSPLARMLLANSITLTPGTLTIDIIGDRLLVHWIYCPPGTDLAQATRSISESFERHISGFLR
jgi:multicomponent Na+:H+ antiporter subunit E